MHLVIAIYYQIFYIDSPSEFNPDNFIGKT